MTPAQTTRLILVRHGNTFGPKDKVVWAGARTDLPLVETGHQQAEQLGQTLARINYKADAIITGPLIRTRQHADIIAKHIKFSGKITVSDALREIDYGTWEALSTAEIHALDGEAELTAWDKNAIWPESPGWTPPKQTIETATRALLAKLANLPAGKNKALLATSNGILRFFALACSNRPAPDQLKVRTGHYCQLIYKHNHWQQLSWNQPPDTPLTAWPMA